MERNNLIKKGVVVSIILLFVSASVIPSTGTIIVEKTSFPSLNSNGYIQDLIDNASNGDTIYIPNGTYYENIIINKTISLVGEDKNNTIIDGGDSGVVVNVYADWVNISGFTIRNGGGIDIRSNNTTIAENIILNNEDGIELYEFSSSNTINNNNILNNSDGIWLEESSNNTLAGNSIFNTTYHGIQLMDSSNNTITDNSISSNEYLSTGTHLHYSSDNNITGNNISNNGGSSISLWSSSGNTITGNTISDNYNGLRLIDSADNVMRENTIQNNTYNFDLYVKDISHFNNDIDTSNTINGRPIYYIVEQSDLVFDDSTSIGYLGLVSCKNISIKNLILTNNGQGLLLVNTTYSAITNLTLYNNRGGLHIYYSSNNNITNCTIYNNDDDGIYLEYSTYNTIAYNTITGKNIRNNHDGIKLYKSSRNTLIGNTINSNEVYGLSIRDNSYNNIITSNNIWNNSFGGIGIGGFDNNITGNIISNNGGGIYLGGVRNTIIGNTISNNLYYGIHLYMSSSNTITGNAITNNQDGIHFMAGWEECTNNIIRGNNISSNNWSGIFLKGYFNIINGNTITNNRDGIYLSFSWTNIIIKNNFLDNKRHAFFEGNWRNIWMRNYWNRPRILPKLIFGKIIIQDRELPCINIDWPPALRPYEIGV